MGLLPSWFTVQVALAPLPLPFFQALREIEIETSIGRASIFRMHFDLSRTIFGDFDALAIDIFRPLFPIKISLAAGLPFPQVLINGYIKDIQLRAGNTPGTSRLEVVGMDALGTLMANNQQPFPWPNLSESAIAAAIFGKYAMIPLIDPLPPTRTVLDTTTIQRIYDAPFLFELARCNSFELYVQPDPFLGTDVGHLHRPYTHLPHQGVLSIDFGNAVQPAAVRRVERHAAPHRRRRSNCGSDDARTDSIVRYRLHRNPDGPGALAVPHPAPACCQAAAGLRGQSDRGAVARTRPGFGDQPRHHRTGRS